MTATVWVVVGGTGEERDAGRWLVAAWLYEAAAQAHAGALEAADGAGDPERQAIPAGVGVGYWVESVPLRT